VKHEVIKTNHHAEQLKESQDCLEGQTMTVNQIYDVFLLIGTFVSFFNASATTVKPVFNGTWIKRKPVLNEQILWSQEYSTKIHIK
jgi:hypothetical protein